MLWDLESEKNEGVTKTLKDVIYGENNSEKTDEWAKNWMVRMKWYGAQMHDVSMGKPIKKRVCGRYLQLFGLSL